MMYGTIIIHSKWTGCTTAVFCSYSDLLYKPNNVISPIYTYIHKKVNTYTHTCKVLKSYILQASICIYTCILFKKYGLVNNDLHYE